MMEPVVVGTDGSSFATRAVVWAAQDAALRDRRLHIVVSTHRLFDGPRDACGTGEHGGSVLEQAVEVAHQWQPGLNISTELSHEPVAAMLGAQARSSAEIVIGHRGRDGFSGMLLGSTGLRVAGQVPGPVVVVRGEPMDAHGAVLVGVDLFDVDEPSLAYACEAATARGARLDVVGVWLVPSTFLNGGYPVIIKRALDDARGRVHELAAPWRGKFPDLNIIARAVPGHPVGTLADLSARADLVVVGSRGLGAVRSAFAGSVSHGVMQYARCPVAVVRPRA